MERQHKKVARQTKVGVCLKNKVSIKRKMRETDGQKRN